MRQHTHFVSDTCVTVPLPFPPVFAQVNTMQALFDVEIGSWEAQVGCSFSVLDLIVLVGGGVLHIGLYILWRDGLLLTGYHLVAGGYGRPELSPYYYPRYPQRGW